VLPLPYFEEACLNFGLGLSTLPSAHPVAFGVFATDGEAGFEVPLPSADLVAFDVFAADRETSLKLTLPGADLVALMVSTADGIRLRVNVSTTR
jgi:hypothetical protein